MLHSMQWKDQTLIPATFIAPLVLLCQLCLCAGQGETLQCFSPLPGNVSRSHVEIKLAVAPWNSHTLVSSVAAILLREYLGYSVTIVTRPTSSAWANDLSSHTYDVDVEEWGVNTLDATYQYYVLDEQLVFNAGSLGFAGKPGLYTERDVGGANHFVDYYGFYQNSSIALQLGFATFNGTRLRERLGDAFPACDPEMTDWCGTGDLLGSWSPPICYESPETCIEVVKTNTVDTEGYFEQLARNLRIQVVFTYGAWTPSMFDRPFIFFEWFPSPRTLQEKYVRIKFPDNRFGCDSMFDPNPNIGNTTCDHFSYVPQKLASRHARWDAVEAYHFLTQLHISEDDLRSLMFRLSAYGGEYDSPPDAACSFLQEHRARYEQAMPSCLTNPKRTLDSVEALNVHTLVCENVTSFPILPPTTCSGDGAIPSSANRSSQTIRIRRGGWHSHDLVSMIFEVLLREYLGYNVVSVLNGNSQAITREELTAGLYDFDAENWWGRIDGGMEYSSGLYFAGFTGYGGREGVYIAAAALETAGRFPDFYKFYANASEAAKHGFILHADSRLFEFVGDNLCVAYEWCGQGALAGYWAVPQCRDQPGSCLELALAFPSWSLSRFEQMAKNTGLPFIAAYYGNRLLEATLAYTADGHFVPYYWFEPDPYSNVVSSIRVAFPSHSFGCDVESTLNPETGTISCDFTEIALVKMAGPRLQPGELSLPEATHVVHAFYISRTELEELFAQHETIGGNFSSAELACLHLETHQDKVLQVVPDCMRHPIPLEQVRVGDFVFSADGDADVCKRVACPPDTMISYSSVLNVLDCIRCGGNLVPDPTQSECIACDFGTVINNNSTGCVDCGSGFYAALTHDDCIPCFPGSFADSAGQSSCVSCAVGQYQQQHGQTSCLACPAGRFADEASLSLCKPCGPGRYAATAGSTSCAPCPEDTFFEGIGASAEDQCKACPGNASTAGNVGSSSACSCECPKGSFLAGGAKCEVGAPLSDDETECIQCTFPKTTNDAGALSIADCRCDITGIPGLLENFGVCGCGDSHYLDHVAMRCRECQPVGEECNWGINQQRSLLPPELIPGYWAETGWLSGANVSSVAVAGFSSHSIFRCANSDTCVDGQGRCGFGRSGKVCSLCKAGYHGSPGGECEDCGGSAIAGVIIMVVSIPFLMILGHMILAQGSKATNLMKGLRAFRISARQLLKHTQTMAVVGGFSIRWPVDVEALFKIVNTISALGFLNRLGQGLACFSGYQTASVELGARYVFPVIYALLGIVATPLFARPVGKCLRQLRSKRAQALGGYLKMGFLDSFMAVYWGAFLFFPTLLKSGFLLLTCRQSPNGTRTVASYPHLRCLGNPDGPDEEWLLLLGPCVLYLLACIAVVCGVLFYAWGVAEKELTQSGLESRGNFEFLFEDFRGACLHWPLLLLCRDMCVNGVAALLSDYGTAQMLVTAAGSLWIGHQCWMQKPYFDNSNNIMESINALTVFTVCIFTAGMGFGEEVGEPDLISLASGHAGDESMRWRARLLLGLQSLSLLCPAAILFFQMVTLIPCLERRLPGRVRPLEPDEVKALRDHLEVEMSQHTLTKVLQKLDPQELQQLSHFLHAVPASVGYLRERGMSIRPRSVIQRARSGASLQTGKSGEDLDPADDMMGEASLGGENNLVGAEGFWEVRKDEGGEYVWNALV